MACRDIRAQGFLIQVQEDLETAVTLPKPKVTFSKNLGNFKKLENIFRGKSWDEKELFCDFCLLGRGGG